VKITWDNEYSDYQLRIGTLVHPTDGRQGYAKHVTLEFGECRIRVSPETANRIARRLREAARIAG